MRPVTLRSDRVQLDVPTRADTAAITEACQDPAIVRWTTVPTPYTERDAATFVDALVGPGWASDREYTWAIRRPGSTWLEGVIAYRTAGRDLGFWLTPSARGAGLAHAAVDLVTDWAIERGAPDVYWECYIGNTGSASVARASGFSWTGTALARIPDRDGAPTQAWTALRRASEPKQIDPSWPAETFADGGQLGDASPSRRR